ncbi:MAG: hypothetical protein OEZ32_07920 [Nitrospinota bacterium]|nr:hypothetical protein [Nitrospinota bacterium]
MKKDFVLALMLALTAPLVAAPLVAAPQVALGMSGGKKEFDQANDLGQVQVFSKFHGAFRYMVQDGLLRAWTDDGATRRSLFSLILSPRINSALVVGPGAGSAVDAALFQGSESVRVVMKNPLAVKAIEIVEKRYSAALADPRTKITYADPATWLHKPDGKYDLIFLWPAVFKPEDVAPHLNTRTLEKVKGLLTPEGTATLWIPMGLYSLEHLKSAMANFASVFPSVTVWAPEMVPELEWAVLIGSTAPGTFDMERTRKSLERISTSYRIIEGGNATSFLSAYITDQAGLEKVLKSPNPGAKTLPEAKTPDWKSGGTNAVRNYKFLTGLRTPVTGKTNAKGEEAKRLDDYFAARTKMVAGRITRRTVEGNKELDYYEEAELLAPDDPILGVLYQTLGKDYYLGNTPRKAAYILERAKKVNPNHAATRYFLGKAYEDMRRYEKATPEYQKLKELEPNFMEPLSENVADIK